jgi:hypothetical protein
MFGTRKHYIADGSSRYAASAMEKMILLVALIAWLLAASAFAARKDKLAMAHSGQPKWTELDLIGLREGFRENRDCCQRTRRGCFAVLTGA